MKAEKQNKWMGLCASLGLHGALLAILIFSLSGGAITARDAGKLDLLWVSLAARDPVSSLPVMDKTPRGTSLTASRPDAAPEVSDAQKMIAESPASAEPIPLPANDHGQAAFPSIRTVAYASAGGHSAVSDAGGRGASPEGTPAFSNAYPLYRENPPPAYPEIARQRGYEGVVLISAEIQADGRVGRAVVLQSSGYAILDQTAMNAVMSWKFEPAKKRGVPCKAWADLPIKFVLKDYLSQS